MEDSTTATTLGRYRLLRRIGRGGMGEVWLAEDPRLQRQVALKVLPLRKRDDQEFLLRFEREARAAAALHHPHILPVHDYGQQQMPDDQTVTYLVMSYVSGGSVDDRLKAAARGERVITQDEALTYLFQVAEAIDYAHAHGIVHRDIKPANMLLREDNWLLLTDFGIARILTDADSSTKTGAYLGTPTYMAPEQAQGQAVPASDIYSLAIVTYQLFTGRVPFHADNPYALTFQHAFATAPAPHVYNPALPPEFEAALLRGMAKDPAQRPLTATAFVTSLQQALQFQRRPTQPVSPAQPASIPQGVPARSAPRPTRRNVLIGAGIGALLVGGGAAAYALSPLAHRGPTTLNSTPTAPHPAASATSSAGAPMVIAAAFVKPVTQLAWAPTKNVLLTTSLDANDEGMVTLWNMPAGSQSTSPSQIASHTLTEAGTGILPAWSPDGTKIALANGGYDLSRVGATTLIYAGDLSAPVSGISQNAIFTKHSSFPGMNWLSNTSLATLEKSADFKNIVLKVWNIQRSAQQSAAVTIHQEPSFNDRGLFNQLAILPNGTVALAFSGGLQVGQVKTVGKQSTWQVLSQVLQFQGDAGVVGWSADGRYLAAAGGAGSSTNALGLWDATQRYNEVQPAPDVSQLSSVPICFAWGPASQKHMLAIGGTGGQIGLWSVGDSATPQRILPGAVAGAVQSMAWSSDGRWLAASYNDAAASILIWRM